MLILAVCVRCGEQNLTVQTEKPSECQFEKQGNAVFMAYLFEHDTVHVSRQYFLYFTVSKTPGMQCMDYFWKTLTQLSTEMSLPVF